MVHLKSEVFRIFTKRWVTLMNSCDQAAIAIEIIFYQIIYMVHDYKNFEFELDPV